MRGRFTVCCARGRCRPAPSTAAFDPNLTLGNGTSPGPRCRAGRPRRRGHGVVTGPRPCRNEDRRPPGASQDRQFPSPARRVAETRREGLRHGCGCWSPSKAHGGPEVSQPWFGPGATSSRPEALETGLSGTSTTDWRRNAPPHEWVPVTGDEENHDGQVHSCDDQGRGRG